LRVTLVNTVHGERGAVTVAALVDLLERISPDVVFAEIPRSYTAGYIDGTPGDLESRAVAEYGLRHRVSIVPVDREKPDDEFFRVTRELFELVERRSRDYRNLVDRHTEYTAQGGLRYLNTDECAQVLFAIRSEVRDTIYWMRTPHLHAVYDCWLQEIELRDQEMIGNINSYAAESDLASGVFLVGAAHRKSIIEKVLADLPRGRSPVSWQLELPPELFE
jgi:hypothetical protein